MGFGLTAISLALATHAAQAQERGGTLKTIIQPEPPILVTAMNQQAPTQYVAGKIYESLLTYNHDLEPQPGLAKSWEISDDGLTYTFHLNEGVKWHDGEPFTADDVVFSMNDMLPEVHGRARVILDKYLDKAEKVDDHTVTMTLKEPFPAFIIMFEPGFAPMMPKHVYEGTEYLKNPANQDPIGTG
ncbi:MAG TPA: ABC transporter substrate-binding protein, partial [Burkholderiaceae bacterium]|nr:ABC transporter substrate-binding protein [Burkholderiaceae bacterium]